VWGLGRGSQRAKCRVYGAGFKVRGLGFRIWGEESRAEGSGWKV
jgi:hypothetical protein